MAPVTVTVPSSSGKEAATQEIRPAHHLNDSKTSFTNPWPSFRVFGPANILPAVIQTTRVSVPPNINELIPTRSPDWGTNADSRKIKATWLGHACFLVELPSPSGAIRGPRILFDPVFSKRCSPFTFVGPARYTEPPCSLSEIPEFDAVVYSHNHYDHMDSQTLREIMGSRAPSPPRAHVFAPLNNESLFKSLSIPSSHYHCLDWWQNRTVSVSLPSAASEPVLTTFRLTCTPAQHFSGRGLLDRFKSLWSSWAVEAEVPNTLAQTTTVDNSPDASGGGAKVWFGGDTGYRSVDNGEDETKLPVCPAFKEIGEKFGGFDLALIPIGAYHPRSAFSPIHCDPQESVCIFKDIRARKAIGMHWGTWILTSESVMDPVERLAEECKKAEIPEGTFGVCDLGETVIA